jgi:indole-3-glycerol phosphate synthase
MKKTGTVLDRILDKKQDEIQRLKAETDINELKREAEQTPKAKDFIAALRDCPHTSVIAEIKKASPSLGPIRPDLDVAALAKDYRDGGAAAMSVLTDEPFFGGCLDDLKTASQAAGIPVLRKDFIVDPIQIFQARAAGADAVLLIVAALETDLLKDLYQTVLDLGMTPLVEVHSKDELDIALTLEPRLLGINNRDLKTLSVSLDTCLKLRPMAPLDTLVVGESGVKTVEDMDRLIAGGMNAFLIGTSLMKADDPKTALRNLCRAGE